MIVDGARVLAPTPLEVSHVELPEFARSHPLCSALSRRALRSPARGPFSSFTVTS
jgi:hypothetical protein